MIVEPSENTLLPPSVTRPRHRGRAVLLGGVAAACVLGVGMGLWARPAMQERRAAAAPAPDAVEPAPAPPRKLQIVLDARPRPPVAPVDVQAATPAPMASIPTPAAAAIEPRAPVRPPEGLIRATAVSPPIAAPRSSPVGMHAMVPAISKAIAATGMAIARAEAPPPAHVAAAHREPARLAQAEPAPKPPHKARAAEVQLAKAQAAKAKAARIQVARAEAAKAHAAKLQLAKLQLAKAEAAHIQANKAAAHKLELAQAAKDAARAEKAENIRLAQAEAKGRAEAREEARQEAMADARKRARLAALAHALARALPHRAAPPPVELAKLERHRVHKATHEPKVEQAALKTRHGRGTARLAAAHRALAQPEILAPQPASGLVRVSATTRCANRDPGEAAVCADPSLGAADRQLARAYQGARAAGVPDAQLRSQQQRWLAARSAAAREAPWAVRDVYMARIAELNGQAKDAEDGY